MICPKCGSENVTVQAVTETKLTTKKKSLAWWICVSWWWIPIKWICFSGLALLAKIFKPKKYTTKSEHKAMCLCQKCGHMWEA